MDRVLKAAMTSGSLNLSNRSLREVPTEVYQNFDGAGEGDNWWEIVDLQKLILAHNNIEVLREDLKNLPLLTVLNVSHNKLTELPAAIGELPSLKSLDVSFNALANIPEEIGSATSLVKIDCSNNKLLEIPSSLGHCTELAELKASNNSIASLPEGLVCCTKLLKVNVEGNKLTELSDPMICSWSMLTELNASKNLLNGIPASIGRLSRVIRLDLHQNRISSIPSSIKDCTSLVEFYIGSNMLSSLPAEMGELSLLSILDLHSNQLREYPVDACKLRLSVLDLSNNSLSGLPAEIGLMTSLRKLVLTGNPMRTIRSTLVSGPTAALLKYLRSRLPSAQEAEVLTPTKDEMVAMAARLSMTSKELSLGGMNLTSVPSEVCSSNEITKVDLSRNSIEELPVALSACSSLEVLILSKNRIKNWPGEILKSLPKLTCLKFDSNPLKKIPINGFEAIMRLQILDLSACVGSLPDTAAFTSLPQLQELYLRRVQLHEVPSDILTLRKLQILDLSQNSLTSIPEGFQNMSTLTELDLSDNNITTLPPELGLLEPSLQALRLDGNPLRSIRRTILDRGTKAILKYLKDKI
ncbi:plant intracellular Ras-group-related LRR protein 6 isoform X1 [Amaranthus tricolor]|uniref:plant intracellular Ras-group-related LRR protein 6 isoform X1 n=1 Tax=Amaranthus tricolor TaxID=29722 RepID=UPI00258A53E2|nr:plant intracellular Ras-group-related LRR protein 6 isoform X1 [Amaranthus tricolor]